MFCYGPSNTISLTFLLSILSKHNYCILSVKIYFSLQIVQLGPDEISHNAAFHLIVQYLPRYLCRNVRSIYKGLTHISLASFLWDTMIGNQ